MNPRRKLLWIAAAVAAAIFIAVYGLFDPSEHFFPRCMLKMATGLDCPGCGSQRAIHSLLTGHFVDAWRYNALMVTMIPLVAVLFAAAIMRESHPRFYRRMNSQAVIWTVFTLVIAWWIWRNTPWVPWQ